MLAVNLLTRLIGAHEKRCAGCLKILHKSLFSAQKAGADGLRSRCRNCTHAEYLRYRSRDEARFIERQRECIRRNRLSRNQQERARYWADVERSRLQNRAKQERNREAHRKRNKLRYAANRCACLAATKRWVERNRDRVRDNSRRWYLSHSDVAKAASGRRRARKHTQTLVAFTEAQLRERMSVFGNSCAYCGGQFEQVDHVKPLIRGGPHCLSNLRPACERCNKTKAAKCPFAWLASLRRSADASRTA